MPDIALHYNYGQQVRNALPTEIRERLREAPYIFALYGPDPWFVYRPLQHGGKRGRMMHTRKTGAFLAELARQARNDREREAGEQLFSYLAGFLCHYTLDANAHPYIIWETTEVCKRKQAHRAFEHTMDVREMQRNNAWAGKHPLTNRYFPALQLPGEMRDGLDAAYRNIYGWEKAWSEVNRSYRLFRLAYRWMEVPGGLAARLAKWTGSDVLKSLAYSESYFADADVENLQHAEWRNAYQPERASTMSLDEIRRQAAGQAVRMITAARAWLDGDSDDPAVLQEVIGNRSYLSGLDVDDPQNWNVPGLLPAVLPEGK